MDESDGDSEEDLLNPMESKPGLVEGFPEGVEVVKLACGDSISVAIADDGMCIQLGNISSVRWIIGVLEIIDDFSLDQLQFHYSLRTRYVRYRVEQIMFSH